MYNKKTTIKLAFWKANNPKSNFINKVIGWWTKGPYSHVELILTKKQLLDNIDINDMPFGLMEYSKRYDIEQVDQWMLSTSPEEGYVRMLPHTIDNLLWEYVEVEVNENAIANIIEFYKMIMNSKYDWFGILGFIIPTKDRSDLWFCSEAATNALKINGCKALWLVEPSETSPNALYNYLVNYKKQQESEVPNNGNDKGNN